MILRFSFIVLFFLAPACTTLDEKTKSEIQSQFYSVEKDPQWRSGIMTSFAPPSQGIGVHFDSPSFFSTGVGKKNHFENPYEPHGGISRCIYLSNT